MKPLFTILITLLIVSGVKAQSGSYNVAIGKDCMYYAIRQSYCIVITDHANKNDINPPHDYYVHVDRNSYIFKTKNGWAISKLVRNLKTKRDIRKCISAIFKIISDDNSNVVGIGTPDAKQDSIEESGYRNSGIPLNKQLDSLLRGTDTVKVYGIDTNITWSRPSGFNDTTFTVGNIDSLVKAIPDSVSARPIGHRRVNKKQDGTILTRAGLITGSNITTFGYSAGINNSTELKMIIIKPATVKPYHIKQPSHSIFLLTVKEYLNNPLYLGPILLLLLLAFIQFLRYKSIKTETWEQK